MKPPEINNNLPYIIQNNIKEINDKLNNDLLMACDIGKKSRHNKNNLKNKQTTLK